LTRVFSTNVAWLSRMSDLGVALSAVTIAVTVIVCGCGHGGPEVARVSGTVTYQGKPVPNLFLNFKPEAGRPSWGVTDAEGKYSLNYSRKRDGAVVGKHKVWAKFRPRSPSEEMQATLPDALKKYGSEQTTPLEFEITTDGQVVDIALE